MLEPLKKRFGGNFYLTTGVYYELIERPLQTKKYKFEALQVLPYIAKGVLTKVDNETVTKKASELMDLMNSCFHINKTPLKIVQVGEIEAIALAKEYGLNTIVIDERTTRKFIEDPLSIKRLLEKKFHQKVHIDKTNLKKVRKELEGLRVIRSFELAIIAHKLGLLKKYVHEEEVPLVDKDLNEAVLEGVLWGLKLNGCSVGEQDINHVIEMVFRE